MVMARKEPELILHHIPKTLSVETHVGFKSCIIHAFFHSGMTNPIVVDRVHPKSSLSFIPNEDAHPKLSIGVLERMLVLLVEIFHSRLHVRVVGL